MKKPPFAQGLVRKAVFRFFCGWVFYRLLTGKVAIVQKFIEFFHIAVVIDQIAQSMAGTGDGKDCVMCPAGGNVPADIFRGNEIIGFAMNEKHWPGIEREGLLGGELAEAESRQNAAPEINAAEKRGGGEMKIMVQNIRKLVPRGDKAAVGNNAGNVFR